MIKRRPATALATFDIALLRAWYVAVSKLNSKPTSFTNPSALTTFLPTDKPPQLAVVLHNFEQLDHHVMQDVFYICRLVKPYVLFRVDVELVLDSKNIPQLPLIFIVDSSAPSTMSYLHATYSRATIALLRVCVHIAPSGMDLVNTVIERVGHSTP